MLIIYFCNISIPVQFSINEVQLQGLELLLRVIGDEVTAAQPVLRLPSETGVGKDVEDATKAGPILFMLPGVEGMGSILEPLAKNLKYQAMCLQLGYSNVGHTAQDIAQALLPVQQMSFFYFIHFWSHYEYNSLANWKLCF